MSDRVILLTLFVLTKEECIQERAFLQPKRHDPPLLWTSPGSGNTWIRKLIEASTAKHTGSVYGDANILASMPGEGRCDDTVAVVKAHPAHRPYNFLFRPLNENPCPRAPTRKKSDNDHLLCTRRLARHRAMCQSFIFSRAIIVLRHPLQLMMAEFQRIYTDTRDILFNHRSHASKTLRTLRGMYSSSTTKEDIWNQDSRFLHWARSTASQEWLNDWQQYAKAYENGHHLHFVRFEALTHTKVRLYALDHILAFIGLQLPLRNTIPGAFDCVANASVLKKKNITTSLQQSWRPEVACSIWHMVGQFAHTLGYSLHSNECHYDRYNTTTRIISSLKVIAKRATAELRSLDVKLPPNLFTVHATKSVHKFKENVATHAEKSKRQKHSKEHHPSKHHKARDALAPLPHTNTVHFSFNTASCKPHQSKDQEIIILTTWIPYASEYKLAVQGCSLDRHAWVSISHQPDKVNDGPSVMKSWYSNTSTLKREEDFTTVTAFLLQSGWVQLQVHACERIQLNGIARLVWNCGSIAAASDAVKLARSRVKHNRLIVTSVTHDSAALALNWAMHMESIGITEFFFGCFDRASFAYFYSLRAPCFLAASPFDLIHVLARVDVHILLLQPRIVPIKTLYSLMMPSDDASIITTTREQNGGKRLRHAFVWFVRGRGGFDQILRNSENITTLDFWPLLDAIVPALEPAELSQDAVMIYCDTSYIETHIHIYSDDAIAIRLCTGIQYHKRIFHRKEVRSSLAWTFGSHITMHIAMKIWLAATSTHGHRLSQPFSEFLAYLRSHSHIPPIDQLSPRALGLVAKSTPITFSIFLLLERDQSQSLLQAQIDAWGAASELHGFSVHFFIVKSRRVALSFWPRLRIMHAETLKEAAEQVKASSWIVLLQPGVVLSAELGRWLSRELFVRKSSPYSAFAADALRVRLPCGLYNSTASANCVSKTMNGLTSCESWLSAQVLGSDLASGQFIPAQRTFSSPWTDRRPKYEVTIPGSLHTLKEKPWLDRLAHINQLLSAWDIDTHATLRDLDDIFLKDENSEFVNLFNIDSLAAPSLLLARKEQFVSALRGSVLKLMRIPSARTLRVIEDKCWGALQSLEASADLTSIKEWMFDPGREKEALSTLLQAGIRLYIVEPLGGLANRLRSMSTAMTVSARLGLPLVVAWNPDVECEARASDLFVSDLTVANRSWPGKGFSIVLSSTIEQNISHTDEYIQKQILFDQHQYIIFDDGTGHIYARTQMHHLVTPKMSNLLGYTTVDVRAALSRLTPTHEVQTARGHYPRILNNCLAVHVRSQWNESSILDHYSESNSTWSTEAFDVKANRDSSKGTADNNDDTNSSGKYDRSGAEDELQRRVGNSATQRYRNRCSPDKFINYLQSHHPDARFIYLACDHPSCIEIFNTSIFAGFVHTLNRSQCQDSTARSKLCQRVAFADLLNLGQCSTLIGSLHSSFSDLASLLSAGYVQNEDFVFKTTPRNPFSKSGCDRRSNSRKKTSRRDASKQK